MPVIYNEPFLLYHVNSQKFIAHEQEDDESQIDMNILLK